MDYRSQLILKLEMQSFKRIFEEPQLFGILQSLELEYQLKNESQDILVMHQAIQL